MDYHIRNSRMCKVHIRKGMTQKEMVEIIWWALVWYGAGHFLALGIFIIFLITA